MPGMNPRHPYESDRYGVEDAGGLIRRLLALQEEQSRYQSAPANSGQTQSALQNPNFRQVSRAPVATGRHAVGQGDDPLNQSFSPVRVDMPGDVLRTSHQSLGELGANDERPAPITAGFSSMKRLGKAPVGSPIRPGALPQIPTQQLSEWWRNAQELLRLYARIRHGRRDDSDQGLVPPIPGSVDPDLNEPFGHQMASRKGGRQKGDGGEESEWHKNFKKDQLKRALARKAKADELGREIARRHQNDENHCDKQQREEEKRCVEREWLHQAGCRARAAIRWDICNRTGRIPQEPGEWGPIDDEVYFETGR